MRNLLKILFVLGTILVVSLNAKEVFLSQQTTKDYSVYVKLYDELKIGNNEFIVKIFHHNISLSNANVNLKLYKPNGEVVNYSSKEADDKNNYLFNIELSEKGTYKYIISYSVMTGGVSHYARGSFEL
jgi:hypothetical protein